MTGPEPSRSLLTLPETADFLRISERHLFRLLAVGRMRRVRLGSRVLILRSEVDRYVAEALDEE